MTDDLFLAVGFGLRALVHRRRTGSSGFRGISGRPGSAEWTGGVLFIAAVVVGMLAPVLQMFDVLAPLTLPAAVNIAGAVIAAIGTVATVAAQEAMGASWRVGVDSHGAAGEDATTVSTSQRPRRAVRRTVRREVTTTCSSSTNTICERRCSATRTTTTTIDHTKPYNSHHHDRTGRSQSRAARRYVADRSYGLINEYEATAA